MQIETERLLLRPFSESDASDALEYLRNPVPNCFAGMKLDSLEDAVAEMRKRSANSELYFAIALKETGKVIGEIEACPERNEHESVSSPIDTFSPCWMLNPAFHRQGYAYEAAHSLFEYLFHTKGARRIYAYTEETNLRCQHLCEKLGMRREGLFIEFISFVKNPDGTPLYENTVQYAILKREWDARKRPKAIRAQMPLSTENSDGNQGKGI